ncbi:MAG: triose-phosphate isomerase, partial [Verrucomicrobia bacterium]|nr:triose-phosphate isomerase [Verrucomicrobiota bacterium]
MEKERKLIVAGNWKMNKTVAESIDLANGLVRELKDVTEVDIAVCPPFTALPAVSEIVIDSNIRLGAQNMSENGYGAHTGEIAAGMLKEFSAKYVILGHSERRQYQRESDELVAAKAKVAHEAGLKPIVCVGEQLDDREGGRTEEVVGTQIRGSLAGLTTAQME